MRIQSGFLSVASFAVAVLSGSIPASAQYFIYPDSGWLSQVYWTRVTYTVSGYHKALDIVGPGGQPIVAARAGTVSFRGWSSVGYGNLVILNHEAGYQTYYAHNTSFAAALNQPVGANQLISYEGTTGNSTGPHCHWEIRRWGSPIFLPGAVYNKVVRGTTLNYYYADLAPLSGPAPAPTQSFQAKVTASTLNVRTGPGSSYAITGSLSYGAIVTVYAVSPDNWCKILYGGQYRWIAGWWTVKV